MPGYQHHIFFCENARDPSDPRGSCSRRGSAALRDHAKQACHALGLKGKVRVNMAGCLDMCAHGPTVVVYGRDDPPEGVWYALKTRGDVDLVIERHLQGGAPVDHLRIIDQPPAGPGAGTDEPA